MCDANKTILKKYAARSPTASLCWCAVAGQAIFCASPSSGAIGCFGGSFCCENIRLRRQYLPCTVSLQNTRALTATSKKQKKGYTSRPHSQAAFLSNGMSAQREQIMQLIVILPADQVRHARGNSAACMTASLGVSIKAYSSHKEARQLIAFCMVSDMDALLF